MSHVEITEQIKYIGADDKTLDLFEPVSDTEWSILQFLFDLR